jgi:hypothetical protein
VTFATTTLRAASQRVFIVVSVYFVINSVRKLSVMPSYIIKISSITRGNHYHYVFLNLFRTEALKR